MAGKEVQRELEDAGYTMMEPYVFPAEPPLYAEYSKHREAMDSLREHDAIPAAVGSGTLNDIVKRSSHECERSYMCVGTRSLDGRLHRVRGFPIEKDGLKQTLAPPRRLWWPTWRYSQNALENMTASGCMLDLLGKVTSGADWLVADALGVEKIDPDGRSLVQDHLREWTGQHPGRVASGGPAIHRTPGGGFDHVRPRDAVLRVFENCLRRRTPVQPPVGDGGVGKDADPPLSHGFKVEVGSVAIAALYELLLERDLADLDIEALKDSWPTREEMSNQCGCSIRAPS